MGALSLRYGLFRCSGDARKSKTDAVLR